MMKISYNMEKEAEVVTRLAEVGITFGPDIPKYTIRMWLRFWWDNSVKRRWQKMMAV